MTNFRQYKLLLDIQKCFSDYCHQTVVGWFKSMNLQFSNTTSSYVSEIVSTILYIVTIRSVFLLVGFWIFWEALVHLQALCSLLSWKLKIYFFWQYTDISRMHMLHRNYMVLFMLVDFQSQCTVQVSEPVNICLGKVLYKSLNWCMTQEGEP